MVMVIMLIHGNIVNNGVDLSTSAASYTTNEYYRSGFRFG
jgi:hypothetical protein